MFTYIQAGNQAIRDQKSIQKDTKIFKAKKKHAKIEKLS